MDYRCKAVFASLSVVAMVLQHRLNVCWGAPMISPPAAADNSTTTANELQGDEFADLQQLRAGLEVLNIIVVSGVLHAYLHGVTVSSTHSSDSAPPTLDLVIQVHPPANYSV